MTSDSDRSGHSEYGSTAFRNAWLVGVIVLTLILATAVYVSISEDMLMRDQLGQYARRYQQMVANQVAADVEESLREMFRELRVLGAMNTYSDDLSHMERDYETALSQWQVKGLVEIGALSDDGEPVVRATSNRFHDAAPPPVLEQIDTHAADSVVTGYIHYGSPSDSLLESRFLLRALRFGNDRQGYWAYEIIDIAWLARSVLRVGGTDSTGYAYLLDGDSTVLFKPEHAPLPNLSVARDESNSARTAIACYGCGPADSWNVLVAASDPAIRVIADHRARRHTANVTMVSAVLVLILLFLLMQRRVARQLRTRIGTQAEFLSSVLQASVDAIIFIDNDNRVQVWNRGAEMTFGYTAEEMIGQSFHRLVPADIDADKELATIRDTVYRDGFIRNFQTQRITKDERRITVNLSRTLITDSKGKPLGSTAILKDVTEKVELDKQLYNTEKLASIGILAAGVAHEINNPLAVILGFTDLLKERFPDGSPERADLNIIEETANNAKKIVENMLGFARVSEGLKESVNVNSAIDAVLRITRHAFEGAKIILITDEVRPHLPEVVGDPREYQQVLFNLVNNAIAAMTGVGGQLSIAAWAEEGRVHVRISDTGEGIPERIKNQIFDPFFTTKKVGQGTGLGLSLSYGIVQKYGGEIRFTSRAREDFPDLPGRTTFTVSMPISDGTDGTKGVDDESVDSRG
ncbi:PAS domain S-box protein [bacterium]|nr:PAS domain S-box protein [bacterium]